MNRSQVLRLLAVAAGLATCLPYAGYWPDADSWKNLWLIENVAPSQFLSDPLAAGFVFHFYFEPLWPFLYFVDAHLAPHLGLFGYHVVNLAAAAAIARLLAQLARQAGATPTAAAAAAVLFLASPPVWICIGLATARNYLVGALFALLALRPFWQAWLARQPIAWTAVWVSTLAYGLAVGTKEAMAAIPLLLFVLAWVGGRSLGRALAAVLPHAVVLACFLVWRWHILGGFGGYWMEAAVRSGNLGVLPLVFSQLLWASPLPALLFGVALVRRRELLGVALVAYLACAAPFVFAGDLTAPPAYPYGSARLVLFWAMLLAITAASMGPLATAWRRTLPVVAGALLLVLQLRQTPLTERGLALFTPQDRLPAEAPMLVISDHSMALVFEHQLRPATRAPLLAYQSPAPYQIDRAFGFAPPAAATRLRIRDTWASPEMPALDLGSSQVWADAAGRMHLRLAPELLQTPGLTLTWYHQNGPTRWGITFPVGREKIDFPLSYSTRTLVLARIDPASTRWESFVWTSPFWRETWP